MTAGWTQDYAAFKKRDLTDRDDVYVWVDGIHVNVRIEQDRLCLLVMIGARPERTLGFWKALRDVWPQTRERGATMPNRIGAVREIAHPADKFAIGRRRSEPSETFQRI